MPLQYRCSEGFFSLQRHARGVQDGFVGPVQHPEQSAFFIEVQTDKRPIFDPSMTDQVSQIRQHVRSADCFDPIGRASDALVVLFFASTAIAVFALGQEQNADGHFLRVALLKPIGSVMAVFNDVMQPTNRKKNIERDFVLMASYPSTSCDAGYFGRMPNVGLVAVFSTLKSMSFFSVDHCLVSQ